MEESWIRYEDIEEKRCGYFVVYSPVFTGQDFAMLKIHIYEQELVSEIKRIAEHELGIWAKRYAAPVMVVVKTLLKLIGEPKTLWVTIFCLVMLLIMM
ncbi:hypothetical protein [Photobacterium damselae]|uniref:hypothetical protein n=1 Tax=Photobacterium damselae TaxID=38293 RepID=UPI001EE0F8CE|nr:hypothetical protein [Photobacterium damselae]MCG3844838.1 hypothetical protein [Photobacterium damselae]